MKSKAVKKMTTDEMINKINSTKKDLFNLRFKKMNGQLTDTAKISELKRDVAKMLTKINESKKQMSKKILNGKVVQDKNDKTIVVLVKRKYMHTFFKKVLTGYTLIIPASQ